MSFTIPNVLRTFRTTCTAKILKAKRKVEANRPIDDTKTADNPETESHPPDNSENGMEIQYIEHLF